MARHFTPVEREELSALLRAGVPKAEIARRLKRHPTTIFRELKRNRLRQPLRSKTSYCAVTAQQQADQRRHQRRTHKMDRPEIRDYVQQRLRRWWSPDQIAGRMRVDFPQDPRRRISPQTIYQWIEQHDHGRRWRSCLRRHPPRKRRKTTASGKAAIADRPEIIERRERTGDWEGDTIIGAARSGAMVSLVERKTGYTILAKVDNLRSAIVNQAIRRRLRSVPSSARQSITFDNGTEFAGHVKLGQALSLPIYFANPHSPWQRGTNEHTNGLVRQYLPKGTLFKDLSPSRVARIQHELNDRPRKRLGYQTPHEMLFPPASGALLS
jgi:transposase, IS30 family